MIRCMNIRFRYSHLYRNSFLLLFKHLWLIYSVNSTLEGEWSKPRPPSFLCYNDKRIFIWFIFMKGKFSYKTTLSLRQLIVWIASCCIPFKVMQSLLKNLASKEDYTAIKSMCARDQSISSGLWIIINSYHAKKASWFVNHQWQ